MRALSGPIPMTQVGRAKSKLPNRRGKEMAKRVSSTKMVLGNGGSTVSTKTAVTDITRRSKLDSGCDLLLLFVVPTRRRRQ